MSEDMKEKKGLLQMIDLCFRIQTLIILFVYFAV